MANCEEEYDELQDYVFDEEEAEDPRYEPCPDGLGLPSDYTHEERADYNLHTLADYERTIRIGLAFDQLDAIRLAVKHRAAHIEHKRKHVRGGRANAASQEEIQRADARARVLASRYNYNFERINALRANDYDGRTDDTPGSRLQVIRLDSDLAIANMAAPRTLHDSQRSGSWIWNVYDKTPSTNTRSVDMVQWFRAKAEKDRADEAVNRLCAEFRRTSMGYRAYAALWDTAADACEGGERAYAKKTAAMWTQMSRSCEKAYDAARRADAPADRLDHTRSVRPYLAQMCDEDIGQFEDILQAWHM
ncbi:hypothetical protein C2E23DRAFT_771667 [Lenzites betulinus]|nr:hypothetical protein C2E23DRAFT_773562 [Lenzites betulinus]KAH9857335.1 hypothetical protein C2E23DRAFT_771667 [Lenzites betulinus]